MAGLTVSEKDEDKTPVGGLFPPDLFELERLLIEPHALFQIEDVEIVVGKPKFHGFFSSHQWGQVLHFSVHPENAKKQDLTPIILFDAHQ
jgi:hypothetical protein